ncbi:MAG: hypothetical protein ACAI35_16260 [Candidatus Methylacidiphilales bacterium]|nr:hypothetical protein [Candidatus Methylacidiphilales bacterium]
MGAQPEHDINGLTRGHIYKGQIVPIVLSRREGTRIGKEDYRFLTLNDHDEWEAYDLSFFVPVQDTSRSNPPPLP